MNRFSHTQNRENVLLGISAAWDNAMPRDQETLLHAPGPGDGEGSLTYLALRVFRGDFKEFKAWLEQSGNPEFGSIAAIDLLMGDPDSWVVRNALMRKWLRDNHMLVEMPKVDLGYKTVVIGSFMRTVPSHWQPGDSLS